MADEKSGDLDELLNSVEAGAKAGGARPYLLDYLKTAKENLFKRLVNTPPTPEALLRVWGAAAGIDELEKDMAETIAEGKQAREILNGPSDDAGQAA